MDYDYNPFSSNYRPKKEKTKDNKKKKKIVVKDKNLIDFFQEENNFPRMEKKISEYRKMMNQTCLDPFQRS